MKPMMNQGAASFFVVGGTMRHDSPSYVERKADQELLAALMRGEFCHVLTARQMGKSSLMLRTSASLHAVGVTSVVIDLTAIGLNLTPEQWYAGLMVQIGDRLGIEDELITYWRSQTALGPMQRWINLLRKAVLPRFRGPLVVFIDEIDAVRSLSFSTDEFFAGIRECYNLRDVDAEMKRLTFCLLGVASVSELICNTDTTPFNVGRRINLNDFTDEEALSLKAGLGKGEARSLSLLKQILYWTGGHPYLTQRVCRAVAEDTRVQHTRDIDKLIDTMFFDKRAANPDDNMVFVREALLRSEAVRRNEAELIRLLLLYAKIRRRRAVPDEDTNPLVAILNLSGITRSENGLLRVRNRIYERAFDSAWVTDNLPGSEKRRQREAYRRGVLRAILVGGVILAAVLALVIVAFKQRNRAIQETLLRRRLSYTMQVNLAYQELDYGQVNRVEDLLAATAPLPGEKDFRGFEWFALWEAIHKDIFHLKGNSPIGGITFLDDGHTLAILETHDMKESAQEVCLIKFYDLLTERETGSRMVPIGHGFDALSFSADKGHLVADGPGYGINIWDIYSGGKVAAFSGHQTSISTLALSKDMRSLVSGDQYGVIKVWDVSTQKARALSKGLNWDGPDSMDQSKTRWIRSVDISPDGRLVAITDGTQAVQIMNTTDKKYELPFAVEEGSLGHAVFFPDGSRLAATARDGRLYVWDMATRQRIATRTSHTSEIVSFAFSPDGKRFATGSVDRTIRLWDAATCQELDVLKGHGSEVTALAWSPDGEELVSGGRDGAVKVWNLSRKSVPILPKERVAAYYATAFTPANELLAFGRTGDLHIKMWNLSTGQELLEPDGPGETTLCVAFSSDTKLMAAGGMDHLVKIWETGTGKLVSTLKGKESFYGINFSPDGKLLVTGDKDGEVKLWEVETGRELGDFTGNNSYFRAVFSPDGKMLATCEQDGTILLWDIASRRVIRRFVGHSDRIRTIAFSADERLMATGGKDNTLRLWDVATGKEVKQLGRSDSVEQATFSPDGSLLITGGLDGLVKMWDLVTMEEIATLSRYGSEVTSITFSNDGATLVVSGYDPVVKV